MSIIANREHRDLTDRIADIGGIVIPFDVSGARPPTAASPHLTSLSDIATTTSAEVDGSVILTGAAPYVKIGGLAKAIPYSGSALSLADNAALTIGTGNDDTISHDGTSSAWTHITGSLTISNTVANNFTILKGGTATSATGVKIVDSADQVQMSVLNDGSVIVEGTLTPGSLTLPDGSLLLRQGVGTGTGELIEIIGPDSTHGFARYQYEATISPAATETALFTVPVMSRVIAVQANVQTALTGGGTTVTFSIGITGDVDAYGTASNSGVQADLLTQNAKINAMGSIAANAGASLGVFSAATVALKLCAAATGGATAGDTALSVGTVKIRVMYETLLPIVNA